MLTVALTKCLNKDSEQKMRLSDYTDACGIKHLIAQRNPCNFSDLTIKV